MSLSEWIREYREYPIDDSRRPLRRPSPPREALPEPPEETAAPYTVAPADRPRERSPRWLRRAERVGYGPVRHS
jgi:hypothetical protein